MRPPGALLAVLLATLCALPAHAQLSPDQPPNSPPNQTNIEAAIEAPDRPPDHRVRDDARKPDNMFPAETLGGARVLDIGAGGGYLALIASTLVGPNGHVDIQNTPGWINQFPSIDPEVMRTRIHRDNIGYIVANWNDLPGEPGSYDLVLMGQVFHDVMLEGGDPVAMLRRLHDLLKPGGRLVIEDHRADAAMPPARQVSLHRIDPGLVSEMLTQAGFVDIAQTDLDSPDDDPRFNVFKPGVRGRTSRFWISARTPASR
ncbi:MAG: methyltransferase domain-containing protein [Hyphomonadaceae bacterium]